jgi:hypothetical protein
MTSIGMKRTTCNLGCVMFILPVEPRDGCSVSDLHAGREENYFLVVQHPRKKHLVYHFSLLSISSAMTILPEVPSMKL